MNASILHDDDLTITIGDSGILFETACGAENLRLLQTGQTTAIGFGDRGMRDAACIHTYYDHIRELIEQNACRVLILDMQGVWFLPSRSLGALLSLRKFVDRIELHHVSDELREGLRVAQLDQVLHVCEAAPAVPAL